MSRLSIVIPCVGGAAEFDGTLVSVLQNRPADCEVLVVHTEPYDDPYALGDEVRFIETQAGSLVELLNIGVEQARGEVLHIVGCGLETTEHWTEPVLGHFDDPDVAAVSPIILGADRESLVAAGVAWSLGGARRVINDERIVSAGSGRRRAKILGPALSAAFYRREVVAALGGFDASLGDHLADVSLALDIRAIGGLHICEADSKLIQHCDRTSVWLSGATSGRAAERLFWRHTIARGLLLGIGLHACTVTGEALGQFPRLSALTSLFGRFAALREIGAFQRHERQLAAALQKLEDAASDRKIARKALGKRGASPLPSAQRRAA